jgi:hypothetical protein
MSTGVSGIFDFDRPVSIEPRLAVCLEGHEKTGKSHWAINTTPDPVTVITMDTGSDAVIQKARAAGKRVGVMRLEFEDPDPRIIRRDDVDSKKQAHWQTVWKKAVSAFSALANEPQGPNRTRTLVIDTGSDLNRLMTLAYFGKSRGNISVEIRQVMNSEFHSLFYNLYRNRPDLNMVWIHKLTKVYVRNGKEVTWDGKSWERSGHNNIGYFCDVTVQTGWDMVQRDFYTEIPMGQPFRYADLNNNLVGKRWYSSGQYPSAFWNMAMEIFPETEATPELWGVRF